MLSDPGYHHKSMVAQTLPSLLGKLLIALVFPVRAWLVFGSAWETYDGLFSVFESSSEVSEEISLRFSGSGVYEVLTNDNVI
ncbi:hypothetical protein C1645_840192 [Glomus cerebriforme]|uniref:Uncharacterized protein n=1 Tax=Glomus cerebriforme TaxID=658196 RepID=A0A397S6P1_9GLOM|nr:hypothetical protein C1645_840192 [Glomus cerebriforme]